MSNWNNQVDTLKDLQNLYHVNISWHVRDDLKFNEPLNFNSKCDRNLSKNRYLCVTYQRKQGSQTANQENIN